MRDGADVPAGAKEALSPAAAQHDSDRRYIIAIAREIAAGRAGDRHLPVQVVIRALAVAVCELDDERAR